VVAIPHLERSLSLGIALDEPCNLLLNGLLDVAANDDADHNRQCSVLRRDMRRNVDLNDLFERWPQ